MSKLLATRNIGSLLVSLLGVVIVSSIAFINELKPTPLEMAESIDMMRILEHGYKVRMVLSPTAETYSVDTPEDLTQVEELMRGDPLCRQYAKY